MAPARRTRRTSTWFLGGLDRRIGVPAVVTGIADRYTRRSLRAAPPASPRVPPSSRRMEVLPADEPHGGPRRASRHGGPESAPAAAACGRRPLREPPCWSRLSGRRRSGWLRVEQRLLRPSHGCRASRLEPTAPSRNAPERPAAEPSAHGATLPELPVDSLRAAVGPGHARASHHPVAASPLRPSSPAAQPTPAPEGQARTSGAFTLVGRHASIGSPVSRSVLRPEQDERHPARDLLVCRGARGEPIVDDRELDEARARVLDLPGDPRRRVGGDIRIPHGAERRHESPRRIGLHHFAADGVIVRRSGRPPAIPAASRTRPCSRSSSGG